MGCVNCRTDGTQYTLKAHLDGGGAEVDLTFCSSECLEEWV